MPMNKARCCISPPSEALQRVTPQAVLDPGKIFGLWAAGIVLSHDLLPAKLSHG